MANNQQALGRTSPFITVQSPPIIAQRAPATSDTNYAKGATWLDESPATPVLYDHLGGGVWQSNQLTLSTDDTFAAASNSTASSSLAIKTYVDNSVVAGGVVATEIASGIGRLVSDANAVARLASTGAQAYFVTPSNLTAVMSAPGPIGDTTQDTGEFTTLGATGAVDFDAGGSWESGGATIDIGADASADAVNLGTGAAARAVTIGTVTGAASLDLRCGTGDFTLEGDVASTYDISATGANTGTITIGGGTGAQTLNLMTGGTGVKTVNIGTGAIGNVVTIGTVTGAASLDLLCGTGNFTLEGNVASTYGISTTGANTGTITIGSGTGAQTLNLMTGGTGVKTVNIGTGAIGNVITIGTVTGAASLDLKCGTGNFTLEGNVASTYDISATGVNTGTVRIGSGTGARTVEIAGGGTGAKTINIGAAASADVITIGTSDGAGSLDLACGTGNFTLEGATASTYSISATGANTGTITIGAGTGAQTLDLMTGGTGVKTVNIATGAIGNVVTIGTVTAAASLDLKCGTGNFTLEGATASTYAISNTGVNTGQVDIAGGTGARTINLGGGGTGAKTINIGAGASADVITIGTSDGAGSLDLACGTGNFTLEGATASTYAISNTGVNTGQVDIAGGTGARTINLGGGGTGAKTINIGAGASADVITIGTSDGAGSLDLACGTGNFTLEGATASTYEISSTGANTGTCKFASGTGARTVEIAGGGTGVKTINIGAAATADIITIGTTTGAGSTTIAAGTGGITLNSGLNVVVTAAATAGGTYTCLGTDYLIATDSTGGAFQINLPAAPATGDTYLIYDATGQAAIGGNVTVSGNGNNIAAGGASAASYVLNTAYESLQVWYDGTLWLGRAVV